MLLVKGAASAERARAGPPLPLLPVIARVRLEAARDHIVVVEDLNLPRGDWTGGDLDLYVAFGAPGTPRAFDARLFGLTSEAFEPKLEEIGEPVTTEGSSRRPALAFALLGPPQMAGVTVHLKEAAFRRALAFGEMARLRLRTLLDLPPEDARGGRELVLRLGVPNGAPVAIGAIELVSPETAGAVLRADARLCGAEADPYPLAVALTPRPGPEPLTWPRPVAPVLALRHASDDLCVRFWTP